jgi:hypothetical protein
MNIEDNKTKDNSYKDIQKNSSPDNPLLHRKNPGILVFEYHPSHNSY